MTDLLLQFIAYKCSSLFLVKIKVYNNNNNNNNITNRTFTI